MNFYLDTGVVFGYGYRDDDFCIFSEKLTKKFPPKKNNYYSNLYILNKELDNLYNYRIGHKPNRLVRMVQQKIKNLLEKINDLSYQKHSLYPSIYQEILRILETNKIDEKPKNYDSIHLTTAHIWDYDNDNLDPYFVTTDRKDILENKDEIQNNVKNITNYECNLKIEYLIDFSKSFGS